MSIQTESKWCAGCERDLPVEDFHVSTQAKDGRQARCKECRRALNQTPEMRAASKVYNLRYCETRRDELAARERRRNREARVEAILHYSGGDPKCSCCGEDEFDFLCLDHIEGGGSRQRRVDKVTNLSMWLKRRSWPEGFRVLCHNCNFAKGLYGSCPHERQVVMSA
jgi:hypothetical protein